MADRREPYVGPRPFKKEESRLFFGRDQEANELVALVTAHPVVLLYAQSGAGKSSLLNAQVIPKLESEGFDVLGPLRVQGQVSPARGGGANIYVLNALLTYQAGKDGRRPPGATLREFLGGLEPHLDEFEEPLPRVIIFDQFEELFTSYPECWEDRAGFFEQVRDAIEASVERGGDGAARSPLRVVFAMREDYVAELDPYAPILQDRLRTRYRLERLREQAALSAIVKPLAGTGRQYAPGVAEQIVVNLRKIPGQAAAEAKLGPYVEPVQLQVVCQSIWQALAPGEAVITERHLTDYGDVNRALSAFYENSIRGVSEKTGVGESALRSWFGSTLITPEGMRALVYRGPSATEGMPNAAVDMLDGMQLIKSELKGTARWYELSHDRFVEPVRKSNEEWLGRQSIAEQARVRLETRAELWRQGRGELLNASELAEAKGLLKRHVSSDDDLRALVDASQASSQGKRLKLLTWGVLGLALLLFLMCGSFVYALSQRNYAIEQSNAAGSALKEAQAKSDEASLARQEAERERDAATGLRLKAEAAERSANEQVERTNKALEDLKAQKVLTDQQVEKTKAALLAANRERRRAEQAYLDLQSQTGIIEKQQDLLRNKLLNSANGRDNSPAAIKSKNPAAFAKIESDVAYATDFLNTVFGFNLKPPNVVALDESNRNSYWDGKAVNVPASAQYLPDVVYHEASLAFVQKALGNVPFEGESGAIQLAYADIYASLTKQKRLNQTAQEADWVIAPGGVAWFKQQDVANSPDRRPIHSLKNPGSAYDDPVIGRDRQVAHVKDMAKGGDYFSSSASAYVNSGIPSKAFYETAIRLGSERAGAVWTRALNDPALPRDMTFKNLARLTYRAAADGEEKQAVAQAWQVVGISVE